MYSKGQTLVELIVVVATSVVVVATLTFAVISSLRNAQFAKNQSQATKLAQEAIERVKVGRDRDQPIGGNFCITSCVTNTVTSWSDPDMWRDITLTCSSNAYFSIDTGGSLTYRGCGSTMPSIISATGGFRTAVILTNTSADFAIEKIVTAQVIWDDFAGGHQSRLTTVLRKL